MKPCIVCRESDSSAAVSYRVVASRVRKVAQFLGSSLCQATAPPTKLLERAFCQGSPDALHLGVERRVGFCVECICLQTGLLDFTSRLKHIVLIRLVK